MTLDTAALHHRLRTVERQAHALRELIDAPQSQPQEVARLVTITDSAWTRVRALLLTGWTHALVDIAEARGTDTEPEAEELALLEAIERVAR